MQGTLVVNHALCGEKYRSQTALYLAAAEKCGVELNTVTNAEVCPSNSDFVLFLDKDVLLARTLELQGLRVFNSSSAIALCDDKARTFLALYGSGIPMPKTMIVPMTFFKTEWEENPFVDRACKTLGFPIVVKEACGSFGWQVWLAEDRAELVARLNACSPKRVILQAFIASSCGRDIRINVVGGKAVACMYRYSETDFRANVSSGGKMKPYQPTDAQVSLAVRACEALGLAFGGVDLLFGEYDEPILCEVNSNAHIKTILECTGVNVADAILEHICREAGEKG